jgi:hypothetical protein
VRYSPTKAQPYYRTSVPPPQCSTPLLLSPTPPHQSDPAFSITELPNSPTLELPPPRSTSGRVLTHAIRAAGTDGSPVAGFVAAAALRTRTVTASDVAHAARGRARHSRCPCPAFLRLYRPSPRVQRYGFRPLDSQASCSAAARNRTASATSRRSPPTSRASTQRRACKVSGLPLSHAAAPPPFPPAVTVARLRAPRRLHASPSRTLGGTPAAALGLNISQAASRSRSEAGAIPCRPPAVFHTLAALSYTP